jgi:hypothetical protein
VQEPENVPNCHAGPGIHLGRTATFAAADKLIAESDCEAIGAVGACAIDYNDFGSERPLMEMGEKWLYQ